jgi:hypothetical protein
VFRLHANQKTNAYAKYTAESKSCMAEYENRPEWQSPLGRFKIRMAQKLIALGHHRNKHPRLGLTPRFNREEALRWFNDLREQKA